MVLQQPNNTMAITKGNVRTTYVAKVVATTLWELYYANKTYDNARQTDAFGLRLA